MDGKRNTVREVCFLLPETTEAVSPQPLQDAEEHEEVETLLERGKMEFER